MRFIVAFVLCLCSLSYAQITSNAATGGVAPGSATGRQPSSGIALESGIAAMPALPVIHNKAPQDLSHRCWSHTARRDECKVRWVPVVGQSTEFLLVLAGASIGKDDGLRKTFLDDIHQGVWLDRWLESASNYWFSHWDQDSPWKDTYVGHPFLGAISEATWIQNDPYGMTMQWDNSSQYWFSRLRALPLSTFMSFEWKLGPISEASIGNSGYGPNGGKYFEPYYHKWANDTGLGPIVTTPAGGFLWMWGEDVVDRHLMPKLEAKSHNPLYLFAISLANPARSCANMLAFRAPWYRPYRHVKAHW